MNAILDPTTPACTDEAAGLEAFYQYLVCRNMAPNTICVYLYAIRQFYSLFHSLTPANLQLYKLYLLEHYKAQTVNLRIRAANCYLEYKGMTGCRLTMIRIQQKTYLDRIISEADYEYLKACLKRDGKHLYYFAIRYMATTGVRVSELLQLETQDVVQGYKDIYSKDRKSRRIYIPSGLRADTLLWLLREDRPQGPLFLNRYGQRISPSGIRGQLKKFAIRYGMDEDVVYPHSFRHRFAKSFLEHGGDIAFLSDLLGHESIETTRIYLRRSSSEQARLVNEIVDW